MTLGNGSVAPDFVAEAAEPGDMAKLKSEFDKRNTKPIGLSVDPVANHAKWAQDIAETLAAATQRELGYLRATALDGGVKSRRDAGYPLDVQT